MRMAMRRKTTRRLFRFIVVKTTRMQNLVIFVSKLFFFERVRKELLDFFFC